MTFFDLSTLFIYWTIYAFLGWIVETSYCSIIEGKFVKRGFLYGPFIPIYAFGALLINSLLIGFHNNPLILFLAAVLVTSSLEYLTSFIMEKAFHMRWWDYSQMRFNIQGRICLLNSTLFGLLSVCLVLWIHPLVSKATALIPNALVIPIALVSAIYFAVNTFLSAMKAIDTSRILVKLQSLMERIEVAVDSISLESLETEYRNTLKRFKGSHKRFLDAFPYLQKDMKLSLREDISKRIEALKSKINQ